MTIRERFAKYTTEEIENGIASLKEKIADDVKFMEKCKAERDVEFYRVAKEMYERHTDMLMDAEAALIGRR
jgi:hypothetical protein